MIGYVYKTTNDINDTIYIGKRQKPKFEKCHKGSGTHFKLALKKYGKEKFHTAILEECETVEDLCRAEKKWIELYKKSGAKLYNIASGGLGGNMVDWGSLPSEKRAEINHKNSLSHMGEKNGFYGRRHTEETKRLLRTKNKEKSRFPEELMKYKERQREQLPRIAQLDKQTGELIKIWDNWCSASREVSKSNRCGYAHIAECCDHIRKSAYGYRWEYLLEGSQT